MLQAIINLLRRAFEGRAETLAIIAMAFVALVTLFTALFGGKHAKIKRAMKKFSASEVRDKTAIEKILPASAARKYARFGAAGVEAEDCVIIPYLGSAIRALPKVAIAAATLASVFVYGSLGAIGDTANAYPILALLAIEGMVLGAIGALLSRLSFYSAVKAYAAFVTCLFESETAPDKSCEPESDYLDYPESESEKSVEVAPLVETVPHTAIEAAAEPESAMPQSWQAYDDYDDYSAPFSSAVLEPETEDLVKRVDRIGIYGSTIDEMKEVAELLRLERAKPQNRTPDRKKRLDDAFASLLRSVSSATKK